jgi:hypothetical protein
MFCTSCGQTLEEGSAFCKECGAPVPQIERAGEAAGLKAGLDATQVRPATSSESPGAPAVPPVPGSTPPPPPPPSGYTPGWQGPPPRRRTGLIAGIAVAVVIVLAGAGVGTYLGLRGGDSDQTASSSTTVFRGTSSTVVAQASTTVTVAEISSSTSLSTTTTSLPSTTTSALPSTTTSALPSTTTTSLPSTTTSTLAPGPDPGLHSPASGSAERKAILDVLRVPVEKELNQAVLFVISTIQVQDDFAFVLGQTVQPSGAPIDYSKTPYLEAVQAGAFSDEAMGLLRWSGGSWKLLTHDIGATDVAWLDWPQQYGAPQAIFPPLGD